MVESKVFKFLCKLFFFSLRIRAVVENSLSSDDRMKCKRESENFERLFHLAVRKNSEGERKRAKKRE